MSEYWLKCSACRKELAFSTTHWVCSVSTCNRNRTRLVFCSVSCWDSHVADARHRDAWAVEAKSPSLAAWRAELALEAAGAGRPAPVPTSSSSASSSGPVVRSAAPASPAAPTVRPAQPSFSSSSSAPSASSTPSAASTPSASSTPSSSDGPRRVVVATPAAPATPVPIALNGGVEEEILIVVSKMKKYIRDRSGMNCSDSVAEALSAHVRVWCDEAIRTAATDGRKTVLDRDVPKPRS